MSACCSLFGGKTDSTSNVLLWCVMEKATRVGTTHGALYANGNIADRQQPPLRAYEQLACSTLTEGAVVLLRRTIKLTNRLYRIANVTSQIDVPRPFLTNDPFLQFCFDRLLCGPWDEVLGLRPL